MNCELYQNSVGIGKLQKLLSFSKDYTFFIDGCIAFFCFCSLLEYQDHPAPGIRGHHQV